jgi:hypothetical protein
VTDTVVRSTQLDGYYCIEQTLNNGMVTVRSYDQDALYLVDESLKMTRLDLPELYGSLSGDGQRYYYAQDEQLFVYDVSSGESRAVPVEFGFCVDSVGTIARDRDWLVVWVYTLYSSELYRVVLNAETGEFLVLQDGLAAPSFCGDQMQSQFYDYTDDNWAYDANICWVWGDLDGSTPLKRVELSLEQQDENCYNDFMCLDNSDYIFQTQSSFWEGGDDDADYDEYTDYDQNAASFVPATNLLRLTEDGVEICELADYGIATTLYQYAYLAKDDLIITSSYTEDGCNVLLLNPSQLTFSTLETTALESLETIDTALGEKAEVVYTPLDMPEIEAYAQTLEDTYGIHILMSSQCAAPCAASGYDVTTTDQEGWDDEAQRLKYALGELETVLSNYPEGYFRQFLCTNDGSGITFMLIGDIGSEDQSGVVAFEFNTATREYIGFDISAYELDSNLYHEIWHATEYKIDQTDYSGLYYPDWDDCNPEGFDYLYSYDLSDPDVDVTEWTYFAGSGEVYFVDSYCYTYPKEDRARLMEYIMCGGDTADYLMDCPALRAKLQLMCNGVRYAFDTDGWDTPIWETALQ